MLDGSLPANEKNVNVRKILPWHDGTLRDVGHPVHPGGLRLTQSVPVQSRHPAVRQPVVQLHPDRVPLAHLNRDVWVSFQGIWSLGLGFGLLKNLPALR